MPKFSQTDFALPWEYVEPWLEKWQTEDGEIFTEGGPKKFAPAEIERLICLEDPVAWGYMNLVEREATPNEDGTVAVGVGDPWCLFPVQTKLARHSGNLIVECGSEVGKTRDIVLGTLWEMDTKSGSTMIAADSDITLQEIWSEIEWQLAENPDIGLGETDSRVKPYREKVFRNGNRFQMRLCGFDGKQFRGAHVSLSVRADEAAKWKYWQQWNELWRSGKPGTQFRIYSTPDGDYSSPFYEMCARAIPIDGRGTGKDAKTRSRQSLDAPKFRKINIRKQDLPAPFWTDERAAKYREQYGGERSIGWLTNVEGQWGSPNYSVFPMPTLKPNLRGGADLPHYRTIVAMIDREKRTLLLNVARLTSGEDLDHREEILARDNLVVDSRRSMAQTIASFFPDEVREKWVSPVIFAGADLGSAQDPTEITFVQVVGKNWIDVCRVHIAGADWPELAESIAWLDHASGHVARWGLDNGAGGSALVQMLTMNQDYEKCPSCAQQMYLAERLLAIGFGDATDEIDIETGEVVLSATRKDAHGNQLPNRVSNKEYSTRVLERKMQAWELRIANDGGAGNQKLSGPQLLVNHTARMQGAHRKFRELDDHHVDSRRQVALVIVKTLYEGTFVQPSMEVMATSGPRPILSEFGSGIGKNDFGSRERVFSGGGWQ